MSEYDQISTESEYDSDDEPLPQNEVPSEVSNRPDVLSLLRECRELRRTAARTWMQMMDSTENPEDADQMESNLEMLTENIEHLQKLDGQIQRSLTDQDLDDDMEESNKLLCQLQNFKNNCLTFVDDH
jgi:nitrate reductase NapAB chaperone NapD